MPHTVSNGRNVIAPLPADSSTPNQDVSRALQRIHQVEHLVESLMASWLDTGEFVHGRKSHRVRNHARFVVTPLDDEGLRLIGESRTATAWDISATGISFTHDHPLSCRYVATTFQRPDGLLETMSTRLKWCRFTRDQRYRSGGKFLKILSEPQPDDLEQVRRLLEEVNAAEFSSTATDSREPVSVRS